MPRLHYILFWLHKLCRICVARVARVAPGAALVWLGECEARWYCAALAFAAFNIFNQGWLLSVYTASFWLGLCGSTVLSLNISIYPKYFIYVYLLIMYIWVYSCRSQEDTRSNCERHAESKTVPKLWKDGPQFAAYLQVSGFHSPFSRTNHFPK